MRDFCVESTAIHEEYVREYNKNILPLAEKLNDVDFYCVTTHPDLVVKKDNIIPIDISVFTNDEFSKSYDHESGFCNILQSTRYGLKAALDNGYVKVIHLLIKLPQTFSPNILGQGYTLTWVVLLYITHLKNVKRPNSW